MNKTGLKNIFVLVFMLGIFIVLFPKMVKTSATSTTPAKPEITLTLSEDGTAATLIIKETKRAEGYQIVAKLPGSQNYTEIAILELDGKKTRKFTIENVPSGKYIVKVRGYSVQNGKTVYGKYSMAKSVTIENKTILP